MRVRIRTFLSLSITFSESRTPISSSSPASTSARSKTPSFGMYLRNRRKPMKGKRDAAR